MMASTDQPKIWIAVGPFGFGPAAIAFNLFSQLKKLRSKKNGRPFLLEYISSGLAMDFNTSLPWDSVHHIDVYGPNGKDAITTLYLSHPPRLTVSIFDIRLVETIIPHGAKTVVIDSLLWYWQNIFPIYKQVDLLLLPDFVGVRECIAKSGLTNAVLLPGMLPTGPNASMNPAEPPPERKGTLINLGGLQTAFSSLSENVKYTRSILRAIRLASERRNNEVDRPLTAIVSANVVHALKHDFPFVKTVDPSTARQRLLRCRTAFMTSGLGNIFDAVDLAERVAFLPAICKSHGLQLERLGQIGVHPVVIDWEDVVPGWRRLDYEKDERACFKQVEEVQAEYLASEKAESNLIKLCLDVLEGDGENVSSLKRIPDVLGRADESMFVRCIVEADLGVKFGEE